MDVGVKNKKNIIVSVVSFLVLTNSFSASAEWKDTGWKIGDNFWWIDKRPSCLHKIFSWKILGIKNGIVEIKYNGVSTLKAFRKIEDMGAYSAIESANEFKLASEKTCKEQKQLEEQYKK